jgi:hypothetical protein
MLHHRSQRETACGAKDSDNSDHDAHRRLPPLSLVGSRQRLARDRRTPMFTTFVPRTWPYQRPTSSALTGEPHDSDLRQA